MKTKSYDYVYTGGDFAVLVRVQLGNFQPTPAELIAYSKVEFDDGLEYVANDNPENVVDLYFVDEDYASYAHQVLLKKWLPGAIKQSKEDHRLYELQAKLSGQKSVSKLIEPTVVGRLREMTGIKEVELW